MKMVMSKNITYLPRKENVEVKSDEMALLG